jgi:hypothetical protein
MMDNRGALEVLFGGNGDIGVLGELGELGPALTSFIMTESRRPAGVDIRFAGGSSSPERGHIFGSRVDFLPVVMLMLESSSFAVPDSWNDGKNPRGSGDSLPQNSLLKPTF